MPHQYTRIKSLRRVLGSHFWTSSAFIFTSVVILPPLGIYLLYRYKADLSQRVKLLTSVIGVAAWTTILTVGYLNSFVTYTVNGKSFRISGQISGLKSCEDKNVLMKIAEIGVKTIESGPSSCSGTTFLVKTENSSQLSIQLSGKKLVRIINSQDKNVVYYSTDPIDDIYAYGSNTLTKPGDEDLKKARDIATEKAAAETKQQDLAQESKDASASDSIDWVSLKYNAEDNVKKTLKAPATAKFPGSLLDPFDGWQRGQTGEYVSLQSYVDSENSFGALIRSDFTIMYKHADNKLTPVYFVLDGKVLISNE